MRFQLLALVAIWYVWKSIRPLYQRLTVRRGVAIAAPVEVADQSLDALNNAISADGFVLVPEEKRDVDVALEDEEPLVDDADDITEDISAPKPNGGKGKGGGRGGKGGKGGQGGGGKPKPGGSQGGAGAGGQRGGAGGRGGGAGGRQGGQGGRGQGQRGQGTSEHHDEISE